MSDSGAVPPALRLIHEHWTAHGRPSQQPAGWFPQRWTARLPDHSEFIKTLPSPIGRDDVTAEFAGGEADDGAALRAFLAAMIWGHGRNGYGAYRTAAILRSAEHAGQVLREAMRTTRAKGGPAGFEYLARHRLRGLGVAFATKYLYFCLPADAEVRPAPILDRVVRGWLASHVGWRPRLDWHVDDYSRYSDLVLRWSNQLDESTGTVEYLMFADGIHVTSQWADHNRTTGTSNAGSKT
ncbi:hypothetical protein [Kribbella karoonensis]|uniref:Uncharacterized protein n=1 Tax=Kribbella karoonensis TaxID=324851 RepID=A0ABN2ENY1_9ACTN